MSAMLCFSLVKMVFGFASRSNSVPTWYELRHAILRNFGGSDDVKPVEVFEKHLRQIDKDAPVCSVVIFIILLSFSLVMYLYYVSSMYLNTWIAGLLFPVYVGIIYRLCQQTQPMTLHL